MSKQDQESLPSITTRENDAGGERSSVIKEKEIALFAREVDSMMDLTRIEKKVLNKIDLESMIAKTEKMVLKEKKMLKWKNVYLLPEYNLWTAFVAKNNIVNEYDNVALVRFFQSIHEGTHWMPCG